MTSKGHWGRRQHWECKDRKIRLRRVGKYSAMSTPSMGVAVITGASSGIGTVICRSPGAQQASRHYWFNKPRSVGGKLGLAMFRLDYLSCLLTILATVLVGRRSWTGLLISIVNSLIVCLIAFRTSQFGFIPANLVCICVYAFSIRSWLKKTKTHRITGPVIRVMQANTEATDAPVIRPTARHLQWQTSCFTPSVVRLARSVTFGRGILLCEAFAKTRARDARVLIAGVPMSRATATASLESSRR
jgi:hypothetical protein